MLALTVGVPVGMVVGARAQGAGVSMRYTMTAFTNDSQTDMWLYESTDAANFTLVRAAAYRPPQADPDTPATGVTDKRGLCRDPSIFRHVDGAYYLAYTTGWDGNTIGFARSTDRLDWTFLYEYPVPLPDVAHTWAPEWFLDGQRVHVVVNIDQGSGFHPHLMTATDRSLSLQQWTTPTPLIGIAPSAAAENGYIDTYLRLIGGRYHAFVKNEATKNIEVALAAAPTGPYVFVRTGNWAGWGGPGAGEPREGQCVIALPDGRWRIYLDAYDLDNPDLGRYIYSTSATSDPLGAWSPATEMPGLSGFVRHFTVLPEQLG